MSTSNSNKALGYGLNPRNKRKKGLTGFGDDDDSDSSDNNDQKAKKSNASSGRSAINAEIAAEQAALRKRAEAAMKASSIDAAVYDYDGEYDNFATGREAESKKKNASSSANAKKPGEKVQSRYITNLLKTAEKRNQAQEIIYERKIAKEQAAEDDEYEGKEKFITSSYKRKLAEREEWAKQEEEKARKEEEEDVTKTAKGGNFLYGGFARNVVMGVAAGDNTKDDKHSDNDNDDRLDSGRGRDDRRDGARNDYQQHDSSRETERWGSSRRSSDLIDNHSRRLPPAFRDQDDNQGYNRGNNGGVDTSKNTDIAENDTVAKAKTRKEILAERAVKLREARERYFERRSVRPPQ